MLAIDDGTKVVAIATVSTFGFAITMGIPALASSAWLSVSQFTTFERLREFSLRYVGKFAEDRWVRLFHLPSFAFLVALLLDLWSVVGPNNNLALAACVALAGVLLTLALSAAILLDAHLLSRAEIDKILKYYIRRYRGRHGPKRSAKPPQASGRAGAPAQPSASGPGIDSQTAPPT